MLALPLCEEWRPRARRRGVFCCPRMGVPVRRLRACSPAWGVFLVAIVVVLGVRACLVVGFSVPRVRVFLW